MNLYALIMAGGEGKRFWPLSTKETPKQFLSLVGDKSLIRQTVDRVLPLIPIEKVFIVTLEAYREQTLEHIPELPRENLILEPEGKNTAPCIAYGSLKINAKDPDSVTAVLPADHAIGDDEAYREALSFAYKASLQKLANGDAPLITLGVEPRSPETGYGYIKSGKEEISSSNGLKVFKALEFTEKPELETAKGFLREGGYLWNSGMFIWKTESILNEFSKYLPDWYAQFGGISENIGKPEEAASALGFYSNISGGSIDKLILESSLNTLVVPVSFPWSDVGSWGALFEYLSGEKEENILPANALSYGSSSCMVMGKDRTVALVGVKDLIVVDTEEALLVLNKEDSQDVKKIVEELGKLGKRN